MSGPYKITTSVVDKDYSPGLEYNEILSIELLPDGFSYAIMDADRFRYVVLEHVEADRMTGLKALNYQFLQSLIDQLPWLKRSFQKTYIAYFSEQLVLLPGELSGFDDQKSLLQYACRVADDHTFKSDRLNNLDGFGVYSFPSWLLHLLEACFPFYRLRHSGSIFIESMLSLVKLENKCPDLILNVRRFSYDMMWLDNGKLAFYRSFPYQQFDDLLYLLFFTLKQFDLKAADMQVMLAGDISLDSSHFTRLSSYFGEVYFSGRNDMYRYGQAFDNLPHHFYYTLLNMNACG
jgi:hypothetical protein